jgi:hypothetical protein
MLRPQWLVPRTQDYVAHALRQLASWQQDADAFARASRDTINLFDLHVKRSVTALEELLDALCDGALDEMRGTRA